MSSFIRKNIKEDIVFIFHYYLHSMASDFMPLCDMLKQKSRLKFLREQKETIIVMKKSWNLENLSKNSKKSMLLR